MPIKSSWPKLTINPQPGMAKPTYACGGIKNDREYSPMEHANQQLVEERTFNAERAIGLRRTAEASSFYVEPQSGSGEVLNCLLTEYPYSHPATTLHHVLSEGLYIALALDIANCQEVIDETGDDYFQAIMYGVEIIYSRCRDDARRTKPFLSKFARSLLTSREGRLDFRPIKDATQLDPFKNLGSSDSSGVE